MMNIFLELIARTPIFLRLRQLVSKSQCLTAEEVIRFQEVDKTRRRKGLFRDVDDMIMRHDFTRSALKVKVPAELKDITVEVCNAYRSAGFISVWLGNPNQAEEKEFPHVLILNLRGYNNDDNNTQTEIK